uniref:PARP catalytic domain-containing protein n=1 Tax=Daphnia galeata TaxID=27404 RepID=A0A8J2RXM2_9CRUS|nr:unnamed protein product [Daphnia galeata]
MDNPAALYSRRNSNEVLYSRRNWMDNESGLRILSAVLDTMSFPNRVVSNRDERYHHDFTYTCATKDSISTGVESFTSGRADGVAFALKVEGKYTDDVWLKGNQGKRLDPYTSVDGEWPVSYHGTSNHNGLSIAREGFDLAKCKRSKHGYGIYSTPDIDCALKFAECATYNGRSYKLVIQNRINPDSLIKISSSQTRGGSRSASRTSVPTPFAYVNASTNSFAID